VGKEDANRRPFDSFDSTQDKYAQDKQKPQRKDTNTYEFFLKKSSMLKRF